MNVSPHDRHRIAFLAVWGAALTAWLSCLHLEQDPQSPTRLVSHRHASAMARAHRRLHPTPHDTPTVLTGIPAEGVDRAAAAALDRGTQAGRNGIFLAKSRDGGADQE